ncbi:MAG: hypothetical protein ACK5H2_04315 [Beutenbergiaceae bacterium]
MAQFYGDGNGPDGQYGGIAGDWPEEAFQALTGQSAETTEDASELAQAFEEGRTIVIATPSGADDDFGTTNLVGLHAYTVVDVDSAGRFVPRNPWGYRHPRPLTAAEIEEFCGVITISGG